MEPEPGETPSYIIKEMREGIENINIVHVGSKSDFYRTFLDIIVNSAERDIGIRYAVEESRNMDHLVLLLLETTKAWMAGKGKYDTIVINDKTGHKVGYSAFIKIKTPVCEGMTYAICYYVDDNCEKIAYHEFADGVKDVVGIYSKP